MRVMMTGAGKVAAATSAIGGGRTATMTMPVSKAFATRGTGLGGMPLRIALLALGALTVNGPAFAQTADRPVGLGQYVLGMSLDDARAVPIRGITEGSFKLSCVGEPETTVWGSKEEIAEGVTECMPARVRTSLTMQEEVYFGDMLLMPSLRFYDGKLFEISLSPPMRYAQRFDDALQLKYGKPTKSTIGEASNALGAKWPTVTDEWVFGGRSIRVEAPGVFRDKMIVRYAETALVDKISRAVRERKAANAGI